MSKKTFYITTPIYYPSGSLHIGHVYTTSLSWTIANYKRKIGYDVKFLTGADEHGQKIEQKAKLANKDPQDYVDEMTLIFKKLWKDLLIDYDYYSRTTDDKHVKAVQLQFSQLLKQDDIFKGSYKGLYSISDEEFLTPTQAVLKDGKYHHPVSGHELTYLEEESYFLKMNKYQAWLEQYYKDHKDFIIPEKIEKELLNNFINKGLEDLSVSRSSFAWGIPILEDLKHVQYVWLDALDNYITALGYNSKNDSDYQKYWVNGDEIVHVVGKEITRFHCIYWPIILKAAGIRIPTTILSHGWIITAEGKMSKSKGNVIDPYDLINAYSPEVVKYFFVSQIKTSQDGVFDEQQLIDVYNANLANNIGNLLSRTIKMILQNFDVPIKHENIKKIDQGILDEISNAFNEYKSNFDAFKVSAAFEYIVSLSRKLNGYIDETKPWTLSDDKERLSVILNTLLNGIFAIFSLLEVVMPLKSKEALKQLNLSDLSFERILDFTKFDNVIVKDGEPLFARIK